jgi:hypothetical protein
MGIRRWLRKIERDSRETADMITLVDVESGEEFEMSKGALLEMFVGVLDCAVNDDKEPDPAIQAILPTEDDPDKLERLVFRDTGEHFWLYPTNRPELREGL